MAMRIGLVSTYPPIHCGVGEYTRLLARAMKGVDPGSEIIVYAESGVGSVYTDPGSSARVIPSFSKGDEASLRGILEVLAETDGVDILHFQHEYGIFGAGEGFLELLREARRERLARRVIVTLHTVVHPLVGGEEERHRFQQSLLPEADAVIVHSHLQEYELQAQARGYPGNLYRIPHGTMVNPYLSSPRKFLVEALGLPVEALYRPVLALPGFVRPDKGLDTLVEAAGMIGGERLLIVVGGEVRDEKLLDALSERENIHFIPRYLSTDEILMLAALSDIIVLPYRDPPGKYAVSGVLHLSMGSLKPVIGSNVPRLYELYTLAPRLVFRSGDSKSLARLILSVLDSSVYDMIVPYASPLYSYAVRTSWPRMARRHIRLYTSLLAGNN